MLPERSGQKYPGAQTVLYGASTGHLTPHSHLQRVMESQKSKENNVDSKNGIVKMEKESYNNGIFDGCTDYSISFKRKAIQLPKKT